MVEKKSIELIPKEVEAAKERGKLINRLRLAVLGVFVLSAAASGGLFAFARMQVSRLETVEQEASEQEVQVAQFSSTEKKVLSLNAKSSALLQILTEREYFSVLLSSVEKSRPTGLKVAGLSAEAGQSVATIFGETLSYNQLATFLEDLVKSDKGGILFSGASLTSVNLDPSTGKAEFVIEATMIPDGLKKLLSKEE